MFKEANYIFYPVQDLHRAERFYRNTLELEVRRDPDEPVAVVHVGATRIGLHAYDSHVTEGTSNGVVTLETDLPIEKVRDSLGEKGVVFWSNIIAVRGGKFVGFIDSEGNRLGIFEPTTRLK